MAAVLAVSNLAQSRPGGAELVKKLLAPSLRAARAQRNLGLSILLSKARCGAVSVVAATLLSGCIGAGRQISWEEVVDARNGEQFVARRSETRRYVVEPGQKGGWLFQEASLEADVPGLGRVKWETSLHPWLLDRANDGRWYLIGMRGAYAADSEYGIFDGRGTGPRFVFYRAREGDWERILVGELPMEFLTPNLLLYGEAIFDPDPRHRYWTPPSGRAPWRGFFNGERLELDLKRRLNVADRVDPISAYRYDLAIVRAKFPWMLDHGTRNLSECAIGGACNDACFKGGNVCRSVQRFDVGQGLGRPPRTVTPAR